MAIDDKSGVIILKQLNRLRPLLGYIVSTIYITLLLAVYSGAGFVIDFQTPPKWLGYTLIVWIGVLIFVLFVQHLHRANIRGCASLTSVSVAEEAV